MPKIDFIEQRLLNWARWRAASGSGELGYGRPDLGAAANGGRGGYVEAVIPVSDGEAWDTDTAINRLHPGGLRLAIYEMYLGAGTAADKATRLGCSEPTLFRRIEQAHRLLADHFVTVRDRSVAERARLDRLVVG